MDCDTCWTRGESGDGDDGDRVAAQAFAGVQPHDS